jgi:hypothetical protein
MSGKAVVTVTYFNDSFFANDLDSSYIKVKLSLCLTKHYAMKTYGGVDV